MLETCKTLLANQYEAALCTLGICIDRCPDESWNAQFVELKFCQIAFHTLFFTDVYLGQDWKAVRDQDFHRDHPNFFRDYEELEPRRQVLLYGRDDIQRYLQHCREKAAATIAGSTAETLQQPDGFGRSVTRAELHLYNIRHLQHHAAQLGLRLRGDHGIDLPWVGSGWRDMAC